jgi:hypothetical protein
MLKSNLIKFLAVVPLVIALAGCQEMPGTRKQQGAVIGGAAGAAAGAAVAKDHRGLGALIGGLLGAGGGYVIAAKTDKIEGNDQQAATTAARKAEENPATAADAQKAMTADLNLDGFVTMDEVVAMKQAGFSDAEMIKRLRATDQVFELNADHQQYLRDHGVSQNVISQMQQINKTATPATTPASSRGDVLGQPK